MFRCPIGKCIAQVVMVASLVFANGAARLVLAAEPAASHGGDEQADASHVDPDASHVDHGHVGTAPGAAEHGDAGHAAATPNPLRWKTDLALWTLVVFLVLFTVLYKFAWGPIATGLDKREHRIAEHVAAAEKAHRDAQDMLAQYDRKLTSVQDEVRAILDEARRDAEHTGQQIRAQAQSEGEAFKARAEREIDTATQQALRSLAEQAANLAVDLAGKIVKTRLTAADHAGLIADAVAKFPEGMSRN